VPSAIDIELEWRKEGISGSLDKVASKEAEYKRASFLIKVLRFQNIPLLLH